MTGIYRFVLATLVIAFHAGFRPFSLSIGVSAVVAFYILSGYAMSGLWDSYYINPKKAHIFILERIVRIFPQYYFWLLITLIMTFGLNWWFEGYEKKEFSLKVIFNAILLIPYALGIYFPETVAWNPIGITTSLANEEVFYLFAPLLFTVRKFFSAVSFLSLVIFSLSLFSIIANNVYSYFFLPGPIVFLFIGHLVFRKRKSELALFLSLLAGVYLILATSQKIHNGYNLEVLIGIILGGILPPILNRKHETNFSKICGHASYGMFLGHTSVLIALKKFELFQNSKFLFGLAWIFTSIIVGWCSYSMIEKPTLKFRKRIRHWAHDQKSS